MSTVDVVVPVYNEQGGLPELEARLLKVMQSSPELQFRFVFVNDGSKDDSQQVLEAMAARHPFVTVLSLSRNFGHQHAVTAGLDQADADYTAIMDADLQDPPELLPAMVERARQGYHVVYGQRSERKGETLFKRASASLFYRLLTWMCQIDIPRDTGDFRVISRDVLRLLQGMREQHRFIRGLVPWTGFAATPFTYDRQPRFAGTTKYPFRKMLRFALDAAFSFSSFPLRVATWLGVMMTVVGALGGAFLLYLRFFTTYTVPGITAAILTVILMGGIQNIMLGITGEYIGRIFEQVKGRPLYVVQHAINAQPRQKASATPPAAEMPG